ncbi:hypothetical protein [Aquiflexum gelatinilyticum]|uniref:Uncharacterized protein n=1 Tax=Aquiflexum gelatinilyticum TaxID=2961943 RepID=A0A9X2P424_9BACT|nr:hypothetical protein [Aquiflexum gelatinilyticum]MCR9015533.1 hypothetical protein [Aquiflexum gelatinilyticum]
MDLGNIIYIIAIIAYFIYTATKKKANPEEMDQPGSPDNPQEQRKPLSFEDLLKEIRQGQGQREKDTKDSGQGKPAETFPRRQEGRTFEQPKPKTVQEVKKIKRYESYEGVIEERALPDRVKLADQERIHSHVEGIKSTIALESVGGQEEENKYKTMLRNPETIKDAVILSEILNRKYF